MTTTKIILAAFLSVFILFFLLPDGVRAANHYVRQGASGSANGNDWTNAWTSLPATLVRGDTYYIADGSYSSYTFDDPVSGTNYITIKKAIASDHGTETGWIAAYGDGQAVFSGLYFYTSFIVVDGQTGQWASDWPGYQIHGFVVSRSGGANNSYLIRVGALGSEQGNIIIRHVEAYWKNTSTWYKSQFHWYGYVSTVAELSYCWFHLGAGSVVTHLSGQLILDHSFIEENGNAQAVMKWDPSEHSVLMQIRDPADSCIIRHNVFRRWESSGCIMLYSNVDDTEFYGNTFTLDALGGTTPAVPYRGESNGIINGYAAGVSFERNKIVNNTFVDINYYTARPQIANIGGWDNTNVVKNNIFYDCSGATDLVIGAVSRDYNWFFSSGEHSEAHSQVGTSDIFISRTGKNYRLAKATNPGVNLSGYGADFTYDPDGVARGADGVWDRGAYEYVSGGGGDVTAPTVTRTSPTSAATYSTTNSTITVGGTASDNTAVTSVTWYNYRGGAGICTGTTSWSCNVALLEGSNLLVFTALDAAYNSASNTFTVDWTIIDATAPILSDPLPTGIIICDSNPVSVTEQITTNEAATVRYATADEWAAGKDTYGEMTATATTSGGITHTRTVSRACGASYTTYFLATDTFGNITATADAGIVAYSVAAAVGGEFPAGTRFGENSSATVNGTIIDAYISAAYPTSKYFSTTEMYLSTDGAESSLRSVLIRVDLSSLPTTATVTAASLYLYLPSVSSDSDLEATIHSVTSRDWWTAGLANWTTYDGTNSWVEAGGYSDIGAALDTVTFTTEENFITSAGWYSFDVTSAVADFVATPSSNYGWLIATDQGATHAPDETYRTIASSQYADASLRPMLIVAYSVPPPKNIAVGIGGSLTFGGSGSLTIELTGN